MTRVKRFFCISSVLVAVALVGQSAQAQDMDPQPPPVAVRECVNSCWTFMLGAIPPSTSSSPTFCRSLRELEYCFEHPAQFTRCVGIDPGAASQNFCDVCSHMQAMRGGAVDGCNGQPMLNPPLVLGPRFRTVPPRSTFVVPPPLPVQPPPLVVQPIAPPPVVQPVAPPPAPPPVIEQNRSNESHETNTTYEPAATPPPPAPAAAPPAPPPAPVVEPPTPPVEPLTDEERAELASARAVLGNVEERRHQGIGIGALGGFGYTPAHTSSSTDLVANAFFTAEWNQGVSRDWSGVIQVGAGAGWPGEWDRPNLATLERIGMRWHTNTAQTPNFLGIGLSAVGVQQHASRDLGQRYAFFGGTVEILLGHHAPGWQPLFGIGTSFGAVWQTEPTGNVQVHGEALFQFSFTMIHYSQPAAP